MSPSAIAPLLDLGKKLGWLFLRLGLLLYVAIGIYDYFFTNRQVYPVPPMSYGPQEPDLIALESEPGLRIRAIYQTQPDGSDAPYTLLYSHGNGTDIGYMRGLIDQWHRMGFNVLAYDDRGYGLSEGQPSEHGIYRDAEAAYQYLRDQGVPGDRIIPYGFSLGGGPATYIAAKRPVAGLILEGTFISIFRIVTQVPLCPFDKFPNLQHLQQVSAPVLIFHGTDDPVIPFRHGQQLAQVHPQRTQFVPIAGGGHGNLASVGGDRQRAAIQTFVQQLPPKQTPTDP